MLAVAAELVVSSSGTTTGLTGQYYSDPNLTNLAGSRLDDAVNFNWGGGNPGIPGVGIDNFSVRWTGSLQTTAAGDYAFRTASDDGVRLWVNNQLLIDEFVAGTDSFTSSPITLGANQSYDIRLEYLEVGGAARVNLQWQTPGLGVFSTIPSSNLARAVASGVEEIDYSYNPSTNTYTVTGLSNPSVDADSVLIDIQGNGNVVLDNFSTASNSTYETSQFDLRANNAVTITGGIANPLGTTSISTNFGDIVSTGAIRTEKLTVDTLRGDIGSATNRFDVDLLVKEAVGMPGTLVPTMLTAEADGNIFADVQGALDSAVAAPPLVLDIAITEIDASGLVDLRLLEGMSGIGGSTPIETTYTLGLIEAGGGTAQPVQGSIDVVGMSNGTPINISGNTNSLPTTGQPEGNIDVSTNGDVTLTETAGDMRVGLIQTTGGNVALTSSNGSILDTTDAGDTASGDTAADVVGINANLTASDGGIGSAANPLDLDSSNPTNGVVDVVARTGVFLTETTGDLRINRVATTSPGSHVSLTSTTGNIIEAGNDAEADISTWKISLDAPSGAIGDLANTIEIDSANSSDVSAAAQNDIVLLETAGNLNVNLVHSTAGDVYLVTGSGNMLDANNDGATNIIGKRIDLFGRTQAIGSTTNHLEVDSSNSTTGGLSANGGSVFITETAGELKVLSATGLVGNVELTVPDTAASGDDLNLVAPGSIFSPTNVVLSVGDDVSIPMNAMVTGHNSVVINVDPNAGDPDAIGGVLMIRGSVSTNSAAVVFNGGDDADTFDITAPPFNVFQVNGNQPSSPTLHGDILRIDPGGNTATNVPGGTAGDGTMQIVGSPDTIYTSIETIDVVGVDDNVLVFTSDATVAVQENTLPVLTLEASDVEAPTQPVTYRLLGQSPAGDLGPGMFLNPEESILSPDGTKELLMQADGNLVVYGPFFPPTNSTIHWASGITSPVAKRATMNTDGNLVLTDSGGGTVYQSGSGGNAGSLARLRLNNAGFPEIVRVDGAILWQATLGNTGGAGTLFTPGTLAPEFTKAADTDLFEISGSDQLQFITAPDFEVPTDANGDGVYEVSVLADDGVGGVAAQTILVTVTDVDEIAPVLTSITRETPAAEVTAADTLVFRGTFDEPVQNVDVSDFVVNGGSTAGITAVAPVQGTGESVYVLTVSGGDLASFDGPVGIDVASSQDITDVALNSLAGAEPATDETYTVDNAAPKISSIVIDDGGVQRSVVRQITVNFDSQVNFDAGAFQLQQTGGPAISVATNVTPGTLTNQVVLTFSSTGVDASGSLEDGDYTLTVIDTMVRDAAGNILDGDNTGGAGGNGVDNFYRLFGDANADGSTNFGDFASHFLPAFGSEVGDAEYRQYLDFNNDGSVNFGDFASGFLPNFGKSRS